MTDAGAAGGGKPVKTVIMGAAGRDFHNVNVVLRDDPDVEVVAFTAARAPGIAGRRYPPALAGPRHPDGSLADAFLERRGWGAR